MKRKLIGFAGRKRSGKTCLCKMLRQEENAVIITIANYLKYLCCELMNMSYEELIEKKDNGYTFDVVPDERWFKIIDNKTKIGVENIRKELQNVHITTIRQLLQVIGTDVIRKYNENWHVKKMIEEIESYSEDKLIVVDDVRFPNEKEAILSLSGDVFFIVRPNVSEVSNHVSETALKWQDFDKRHIILNDNITEEKFKLDFLIHYRNNFDFFIMKSIFLYENENYLKRSDFGTNYNSDKELIDDILRQNRDKKLFNEYGIIRYKTCSRHLAKEYVEKVDDTIKYAEDRCNEFITCNPLIVENLKIYI
jgi:DNA-directed RNA polymerase subunit N (RpoN/RPB10)